MEACAPRQENVAIVATQTLGGGALSTKYMFERNKLDRVSLIYERFADVFPIASNILSAFSMCRSPTTITPMSPLHGC